MRSKKGFELSINFIVILILSIVIFGFGIKFAYNLAKQAEDIQKRSSEELDREIGELQCGFDKVCLDAERKTISRGKSGLFGVKITNVFVDNIDFIISVDSPNNCFVDKNGIVNSYSGDKNKCFEVTLINGASGDRTINIVSKESSSIGIGASVGKKSEQGTYIFNIEIKVNGQSDPYYSGKLYIEVK